MRSRYACLLVGLFIVGLTVAGFFLFNADFNDALTAWCFGSMLFAEVVFFLGLAFCVNTGDSSGLFRSLGAVSSLALYGIGAVGSSLFVVAIKPAKLVENVNTFIFMQLALVVAFIAVFTVVLAFTKRSQDEDAASVEAVSEDTPKRGGF